MKNYKDLYKQQESKLRTGGQGTYYGQQGISYAQNVVSQQPTVNQNYSQQQPQSQQQQRNVAPSSSSSLIMKQQSSSSQQIMTSNKPIQKTPLSSLIYQSISNNEFPQHQQQQAIINIYIKQKQHKQYFQPQQPQSQQQSSKGIQNYQQQHYSHSQHVSANHSRDNSMNNQRQPERKLSITGQGVPQQKQQIQNQQQVQGNGVPSGSFYHHNHSNSHQIPPTPVTAQQTAKPSSKYGSTSLNQSNNNINNSQYCGSQLSSHTNTPNAASSSTTSTSQLQQPSANSFTYKPAHKSSVPDASIIQKLMKKQSISQQQQQPQQQYPFSQPQSYISSPKKSPKNCSISPNTRIPQMQQSALQEQLSGGYGQQQQLQSNQLANKNTYQQMYHQLSNNYSRSTSQKHSQQSSISSQQQTQQQLQQQSNQYNQVLQPQKQQQPSTSQLNVSINNISSNNIQLSQNNNQISSQNANNDSVNYQKGCSNQTTDKKPISFLNYLLLKEIAQRNTQDQIGSSSNINNMSNADIMASKMNTPNNATKILINNFNEPQSINKSGTSLYACSGSNYNVFNQAPSQAVPSSSSQQKQSSQDLDNSYLSKYSQILQQQQQQQSKQVSQPPSPFTYSHSQKNSIASTTNTNNIQANSNISSYSVASQLPQSYSYQTPSTPASTHRSQQQQQQSDFSQSQSQKNTKYNQNGANSNTQLVQNNTPQDDFRNIPSCTSKNFFNFHYVIGKGGFGKVWKVEHRKTRQLFAMKEMSKSLVITKKSVSSVMNERNLLSQLKHPFLVNMFYAFQDRESLHLVMDLMPGGDLRYHIGRQRRFSEEQTRFFVACIFMGLEYLHNNNIIHRDIKPENLVLDSSGYVRITDLGIARTWKPDNANDTSGTPGYMAPEVMCRQPHTFAVDYFALGVLAYEFMLGRRPYLGRSRKEIRDQILAKRVQIKKHEIPDGWSLEAADFINRLIERKPANRLGINGPAEVKNHPWIKNYPWQKLIKKQIDAPFLPANEDNFDQKQQISLEDEQNSELILQNAMLLKRPSVQSLFNGYNFDGGALNQQQQQQLQQPTSLQPSQLQNQPQSSQQQSQQVSMIQSPQPTNQLQYQPQQYGQTLSQQQQQQYSQLLQAQQQQQQSGTGYNLQQLQQGSSTVGYQLSGYQNPFSQRNSFSNVNNISQNMSHISQQSNQKQKENNYNDSSMLSMAKNNIQSNNNSIINSSRVYQQNQNNNSRIVGAQEKENFIPSRYSYDEIY